MLSDGSLANWYRRDGRHSTAAAYLSAAGAVGGALLPIPIPVVVGLVVSGVLAAIYVWRPNPVAFLVLFAVLVSMFAARAIEGLSDAPRGAVSGWAALAGDPRPIGARGVTVTVRFQSKLLEARAFGRAATELDDRLAGERVLISGFARATSSDWLRNRHIGSEVIVKEVRDSAPAAPIWRVANGIRTLLSQGAESLTRTDRSLFAGMVLGDDRHQSPKVADDFRAAGMGHLLVVSGQNVAFVLALVAPAAMRLRPGSRLLVLLGVLGVFAVLTRFEPSVLRAVFMAAFAVSSAALGRPEVGRRTLGWAIAIVLMVDPFLVRSLAFQLSVCATAGILWITPSLIGVLRGPRAIRLAIASTAGAQLAVMPLLIGVFGSVPLASLPANVLAGPASAPVLMWGLTAGLLAGVSGGWLAWLIHRVTAALLWWVRGVASAAATAPAAEIGVVGAIVVTAATGAILIGLSRGSRSSQRRDVRANWARLVVRIATVAIVAVFGYSLVNATSLPKGWSSLWGAKVFNAGDRVVVVLEQPPRPQMLLESLRRSGARRVDLIVASDGDAAEARAVLALASRFDRAAVVAPPMHRVPLARTVRAGTQINLGPTTIDVVRDQPALVVEIRDTTQGWLKMPDNSAS